jgi:hypothetical protein
MGSVVYRLVNVRKLASTQEGIRIFGAALILAGGTLAAFMTREKALLVLPAVAGMYCVGLYVVVLARGLGTGMRR